jgi:hypothetical protein
MPRRRPTLDKAELARRFAAECARIRLRSAPLPACAPSESAALAAFDRRALARSPRLLDQLELAPVPGVHHGIAGNTGAGLTGVPAPVRGRWGTSRNWSGAVIAAHDGATFTRVAGSWKVPRAERPEPCVPDDLPGGVWQQSVWVGLDGYRLASRSLPQVGTASQVGPAGERYYLWVQWWVRGAFFGEIEVKGFPVQAGDEIFVSLDVVAPDNVRFHVVNRRATAAAHDDVQVAIDFAAGRFTGDMQGNLEPSQNDTLQRGMAPVEGRHAVWCVERPSVMPTPEELEAGIKPHETVQYRMPRFHQVVFDEALALMRRPDGGCVTRTLRAARRIRMIDVQVAGADPLVFPATTPLPPRSDGSLPLPPTRLQVNQLDPERAEWIEGRWGPPSRARPTRAAGTAPPPRPARS